MIPFRTPAVALVLSLFASGRITLPVLACLAPIATLGSPRTARRGSLG